MTPFTRSVIKLIRLIPHGKVSTYGYIANMAGNRRAARQIARILHTCSRKQDLPWHRVVNREGRISLKPGMGFNQQKTLLQNEKVQVDETGRIDLEVFLWFPGTMND